MFDIGTMLYASAFDPIAALKSMLPLCYNFNILNLLIMFSIWLIFYGMCGTLNNYIVKYCYRSDLLPKDQGFPLPQKNLPYQVLVFPPRA